MKCATSLQCVSRALKLLEVMDVGRLFSGHIHWRNYSECDDRPNSWRSDESRGRASTNHPRSGLHRFRTLRRCLHTWWMGYAGLQNPQFFPRSWAANTTNPRPGQIVSLCTLFERTSVDKYIDQNICTNIAIRRTACWILVH